MARGLKVWIRFWKLMNCSIYVAKTKSQTSYAVSAQLVCAVVFAYKQKIRFSHDVAQVYKIIFCLFQLGYTWSVRSSVRL